MQTRKAICLDGRKAGKMMKRDQTTPPSFFQLSLSLIIQLHSSSFLITYSLHFNIDIDDILEGIYAILVYIKF